MGLVSTEVEVKLASKNIKHYESLGYEIPRYKNKNGLIQCKHGTKINVKVKDLLCSSSALVDVQCDFCKKTKKIKYKDYNMCNHDGLYYCKDCARTVFNTGNKYHFNSNITDEEREIQRKYPEYIEFIKKVLARDNYTCQCCGKSYNNMEVHHLNGYNWYKDGRTNETNAITLCENCHGNFHSIYGRGNNTKEQYEEWIGYAIVSLSKYNGILPIARQIYCFEENKVYDSANELAEEWGVYASQVYLVCNKSSRCKSVKGKHLIWYDIYLKNTQEENELYLIRKKRNMKFKEIILLNNLEVFSSISKATKLLNGNTKNTCISNNCQHKTEYAYKHPITNEKLYWCYYEEYQAYSDEEKQRLKDQYYTGSFLIQKETN